MRAARAADDAPAIVIPSSYDESGQFALPFPAPAFGIASDFHYRLPEIEKRDWRGNPIPPILAECGGCGEEFPEDEMTEHSDGINLVCEDCRCDCEECGDTYANGDDDIREAADGDEYRRNYNVQTRCENCRWQCDDCSDWFYGAGSRNAAGDRICNRCGENYYTCEDCNDVIHSDNTWSIDGEDGVYCQSCYDSHMENREEEQEEEQEEEEENIPRPARRGSWELINDYRYKPAPQFLFADDEDEERTAISPVAFFGLEIETQTAEDGYHHDNAIRSSGLADDGAFYVKRDGSLAGDGACGFEIVSHPGTLQYWLSRSLSFAGKLKAAGYDSDNAEECGMHIHVSRVLTTAQTAKLLLFAKQNANLLRRVSRRVSADEYYYAAEAGSVRQCIGKAESGEHSPRYSAINLQNSRTIEFRFFQGTLDAQRIKFNVAFVAALVDFIRSAPLSHMACEDFRDYLVTAGRKLCGREMSSAILAEVDAYMATLPAEAA